MEPKQVGEGHGFSRVTSQQGFVEGHGFILAASNKVFVEGHGFSRATEI
jgi:hypothetical protein